MKKSFSEISVIVTGAASGMGAAISKAFAEEGANLILADINENGLNEIKSICKNDANNIVITKCDVSKAKDAKKIIDVCCENYGKVGVLVNNAGIGLLGTVVDLSEEDWDREIDVNLKGVFLCSKYAIAKMKESGGGVIINISSGAGIFGGKGCAGYCASKGGVVLLTKAMALDHAKDNIRINSVAPGIIDTPFNDKVLEKTPNPLEAKKRQEDITPLGRLGKPEEIAKAVLFLASEDASFMIGSIMSVDGGLSAQ